MKKSPATPATAAAARKKKADPVAAVSLTEEAYRLLKWKILSMELAPGTSINEQGLVEATGFGRAPIHQALHQLQYDGLIEIRPRKGAQVKVWSPRDFGHLMEARIPLESAMVRLAALRAEEDEIRALQERLDEGPALIEASDRESLMLLDHHFHSTLGAFAHSPVLAEMVENLHHRSALFWYIPISGRKEYEVVLRQHQEILDAVAARDPDAAAAAMAAHISGLAHTTNL